MASRILSGADYLGCFAVLYYPLDAWKDHFPVYFRPKEAIMEQLVDTHCHLDFDLYANDLDDVLARAASAGVGRIIVPGIDLNSSRAVVELARKHEIVLAAVGVHPNSSAGWQEAWVDDLRDLAQDGNVVAIGEIGLDYYRDYAPHGVQKEAFEAQLSLAAEIDLPVIIHNREADHAVLERLRQANPIRAVLHSFSSSWSTAAAALDAGYFLGFTGPITFKNAGALRDVAAQTPLDRLLVETDGPFLTPQPYRGKRNEPAYVRYVAEKLAQLKGLPADMLARQTSANAISLFGDRVATG